MMSPGSTGSLSSFMHDLMSTDMAPICAGLNSATAIISPSGLASPQVKSSASLKIVEYDVFISTMPICRQTEIIACSMMVIVTRSISAPPGWSGRGMLEIAHAQVAVIVDRELLARADHGYRGRLLHQDRPLDDMAGSQGIAREHGDVDRTFGIDDTPPAQRLGRAH